jgi:diguanylate cyclase (GGDEF)-like protein
VDLIEGIGYPAIPLDSVDEAVKMVTCAAPPDVVVAPAETGEKVIRAARQLGDARPPIVIVFPAQQARPPQRCAELGADSFLVRPYRRDVVAAVLGLCAALRAERRRAGLLADDLSAEKEHFFKQSLVLELKRARRFGYSLAACLVGIDPRPTSPEAQKVLHAQIARRVRSVVRDIDIPVDYAEDRFLVFLPYTDLAGAERVGKRLEAAVRGDPPITDGDRRIAPSVSIGISSTKSGKAISFARLVRNAATALRAAQLKGGGRVIVRP